VGKAVVDDVVGSAGLPNVFQGISEEEKWKKNV
jgi:hypothetical protein